MIGVKDIGVSSSTVNGREKVSLDFSSLSNVSEGDTTYISVFGDSIETESIAASTTELWLEWIVSSFNIKATNSVASRNNKVLEILCNNSTESNLAIDTGNVL